MSYLGDFHAANKGFCDISSNDGSLRYGAGVGLMWQHRLVE
jgi:hypothetical protein